MIGAEPHAVFAQRRARGLVEILHLGRDLRTLEHAERFDQLECDAAADAGDVLGLRQTEQRAEQFFNMRLQPEIEPRLHGFARSTSEAVVGDDAEARMQRVFGGDEFCHRIAGPADGAVGRQHELVVGRSTELGRARVDLAGEHLLRRRLQCLGVRAGFSRVGRKCKSVEPANRVAFHNDFAGLANFRIQN